MTVKYWESGSSLIEMPCSIFHTSLHGIAKMRKMNDFQKLKFYNPWEFLLKMGKLGSSFGWLGILPVAVERKRRAT